MPNNAPSRPAFSLDLLITHLANTGIQASSIMLFLNKEAEWANVRIDLADGVCEHEESCAEGLLGEFDAVLTAVRATSRQLAFAPSGLPEVSMPLHDGGTDEHQDVDRGNDAAAEVLMFDPDVIVYHTYSDGVVSAYHFSTVDDGSPDGPWSFDIHDLPWPTECESPAAGSHVDHWQWCRTIIRHAIATVQITMPAAP